jgi:hypothetical protein
MNRWSAAVIAATAAVSLAPLSSGAATPSPNAVRAAELATQKAQAVTYALLDRTSGVNIGTVTLQRIGSVRSRIRVELKNPALSESKVTLRTGRDCQEPRVANAPHSPILLNPFTGHTSDTIVNVPLNNLSSGKYLLDVQTATARAQAIDACAHLK